MRDGSGCHSHTRYIMAFAFMIILGAAVFISFPDGSDAVPQDIEGSTLQWEFVGGTLTISGTGSMPDYDYSGNFPPWHAQRTNVTSLVIGDGVSSLGTHNFYGMNNLISLRIGNGLTSIEDDSFDGTFKDYYNTDIATTADNVKGLEYTWNNAGSFYTVSGYSVVFDSKGGSSVQTEYVNHGGTVSIPSPIPSKNYYTLAHWCSDVDCTVEYEFSSTVTSRMTLYAKWTPVSYDITYYLYDSLKDTTSNPNSYTIESSTFVLADPQVRLGYTFQGWFDAETGGNQVTQIATGSHGNKVLYAHWTPDAVQYNVSFYSDGSLVSSSSVVVGDVITAPADPVKTDPKYEFTFTNWDGFTPGMIMTAGDKTFNAVFVKSAKVGYDPIREEYTATVDEDSALITKAKIDEIVDKAKTDRDVTMALKAGEYTVRFDNEALRSLKSSDTELVVEKTAYADQTTAQKRISKGAPLFDITFGDNTDFNGGKVTFTIPYDKGGKDESLMYVAHILNGKVNEEIECTYNDDGTVSFDTGHLSVYTILYKEAKKTNFLENLSIEHFITFGVIFAIALSGILFALFKKMKG